MVNNYTDSFAGDPYFIKKGEQLSAAGMTAALNTKEKVANKVTTVNNQSTDAQYPSAKVIYDTLSGTDNDIVHKASAETITGVKTFDTASMAAEPLLGAAKTTDTTNDGTKFASEAQVYKKQDKLSGTQLALLDSLSTLGFFPRGTILPFSATAWDEASADFKKIWKICDGQNGTLNLVNKFIRGGAYADYGRTGGTDTAQLPYHAHEVYDPGHGHGVNDSGHTHNWVRDNANGTRNEWGLWPDYGNCYLMWGVSNVSIQNGGTNISINPAGGEADNRPAFCTVIFIEKIMP
ncbi:MAG: hypothetical protein LBK68_01180 [Candidatus Margulisbacteria bacterium]|jgi:hypothetical protein|nr:hypothetical protein [Candidatus Margulisiibacteriota bacterium]